MSHTKEFFLTWAIAAAVLMLLSWYAGVDFTIRGPIQAILVLVTTVGSLMFAVAVVPNPTFPMPIGVERTNNHTVGLKFGYGGQADKCEASMREYIGKESS